MTGDSHRKFIVPSFTNTTFAFTRRTCLAAAKTILREAFMAGDGEGPVLWIEQAFSVAAAIILSLDVLHRSSTEKEVREHRQLVTDTISYLKRFDDNKIATRGVQLLSFLQEEADRSGLSESRKRRHASISEAHSATPRKHARTLNMHSVIRNASQNLAVTPPATIPTSTPITSMEEDTNDWHTLIDLLPAEIGFDSQYLFDSFSSC
jgi:hypothetical protein